MSQQGTASRLEANKIPSQPFLRRYGVELLAGLLGGLAMNGILLAGAYWAGDTVDPAKAGQLGDFVGGYVGTAFVLVSALLLYRTLRTQRESSQLQSFEARYFELIRLHRENVVEMKIKDVEGRRIFLPMIREFWAAHKIVADCAADEGVQLTQRQLLHITYHCLFFGSGHSSSPMLKASLPEYPTALIEEIDRWLRDDATRQDTKKDISLPYEPFEGHQSRLGHYYRHLYQAVTYVDLQVIDIGHYAYVKTIRAQLSTHEQAMLLLNSFSPIGANWWNDGLILRYRMVKNIPRNFFAPSVQSDILDLFPSGYFEWEDPPSATGKR